MNKDDLDKKITEIHKSTKTTFPFMVPFHDWARIKFKRYYNWHLNSNVNKIHLSTLIVCIFIVLLIILFIPFPAVTMEVKTSNQNVSIPLGVVPDDKLQNVSVNSNSISSESDQYVKFNIEKGDTPMRVIVKALSAVFDWVTPTNKNLFK